MYSFRNDYSEGAHFKVLQDLADGMDILSRCFFCQLYVQPSKSKRLLMTVESGLR